MFNGLRLLVITAILLNYEFRTGTALSWPAETRHIYRYLIQGGWFSRKTVEQRNDTVIEFNSDEGVTSLRPSTSTRGPLSSEGTPTSTTSHSTETDHPSTGTTGTSTDSSTVTSAYNATTTEDSDPLSTTPPTTATDSSSSTNDMTMTQTNPTTLSVTEPSSTPVATVETLPTETTTTHTTGTETPTETSAATATDATMTTEATEVTSDSSTSTIETTVTDDGHWRTTSSESGDSSTADQVTTSSEGSTVTSIETTTATTSERSSGTETVISTTNAGSSTSLDGEPTTREENATTSSERSTRLSSTSSSSSSSSSFGSTTESSHTITRTTWECVNNSNVTVPATGVQVIQTPEATNQAYGCYVYLTGSRRNVLANLRTLDFGGRTCGGNFIYLGVSRFCWSDLSNTMIGLMTYDSTYYLYIEASRLSYPLEVTILFDDDYAAPFVASLGPSALSFLFVGYFDPRGASNVSSYPNTIQLPSNTSSSFSCQSANLLTKNNANICLVAFTDSESVSVCQNNLTTARTVLTGSWATLYLSSNVLPLTFGMAAFQCSLVGVSEAAPALFAARQRDTGQRNTQLSTISPLERVANAVNGTWNHTIPVDELVPWSFVDTAVNGTNSSVTHNSG